MSATPADQLRRAIVPTDHDHGAHMLTDLGHGRSAVAIVGPATIAEASGLRDQLAAAIATASSIDVDVDASSVDLSSIQLLLSASRSLQQRGGRLRLTRPPSGALLEALLQGGFLHPTADDLWSSHEDDTHR